MTPEELKAIREAMGLSQGKLGERLGVTYETVGRWERGIIAIDARTEFAVRWLVHLGGSE